VSRSFSSYDGARSHRPVPGAIPAIYVGGRCGPTSLPHLHTAPSVIVVQTQPTPWRGRAHKERKRSLRAALIERRAALRASSRGGRLPVTQQPTRLPAKPSSNLGRSTPALHSRPLSHARDLRLPRRPSEESSDYSIISGVIYARSTTGPTDTGRSRFPFPNSTCHLPSRATRNAAYLPSSGAPNEVVTRP